MYDTTLRDGTQGENINFSADEKLRVAKRLDDLGIHYIEGGWPGSNPRDIEFFELAQKETFKIAKITAFGSTRKPGISPEDDPNLAAILKSQTSAVAIFGKSWPLHVTKIMNNTLSEDVLTRIGKGLNNLRQGIRTRDDLKELHVSGRIKKMGNGKMLPKIRGTTFAYGFRRYSGSVGSNYGSGRQDIFKPFKNTSFYIQSFNHRLYDQIYFL